MIRNALPTGLALVCALAGPVLAEEDRYIGVFVGSQHIGSDEVGQGAGAILLQPAAHPVQ